MCEWPGEQVEVRRVAHFVPWPGGALLERVRVPPDLDEFADADRREPSAPERARPSANTSDLEWFALLVGGDGAVVRCDPDCLGGVAGGLRPVPVLGAFEFVVGHLVFDHAGVAA